MPFAPPQMHMVTLLCCPTTSLFTVPGQPLAFDLHAPGLAPAFEMSDKVTEAVRGQGLNLFILHEV